MNAQQLKNAILQEAIEGRLVAQDPNDEPASALLARIRKEKEQLVKAGKLKKKDLEVKPISEDEIPFEIPDSWEWCRMSSLIQLLSGQDFPPEKYNSDNKGVPYITGASNIENGKLVINRWTETPSVIGEDGDLLIVCKGSGVGKMCISDIPVYHIARQIQIVRCFSSSILLDFLKINIDANLQNIVANAQGVIPGISRDHILDLLLPIPPLAEQHRIVAKIEELLPKVEEYGKAQDALNKLNAELPERLKKSILQEAIEGRLVPQDPNDEPASVLLDKIRKEKAQLVKEGKLKKKDIIETPITDDEKPFDIPNTWEWVRLSFIAHLLNGYAFKSGLYVQNGIRVIRITNVQDGEIVDDDPKYYPICEIDKIKKYLLAEGDLLMSLTGNVGRVGILDSNLLPAALNQRVACIRLFDDCLKDYIFSYYRSDFFRNRCVSSGKGMAQLNISTDWLGNDLLPLPPLAEQKRIVAKIEELFAEIDKLK